MSKMDKIESLPPAERMGRLLVTVVKYFSLLLATFLALLPLVSCLLVSFKTDEEYQLTPVMQLPENLLNFENFRRVWVDGDMGRAFATSFFVVVVVVAFSVLVGSMLAYVLNRFRFPGNGLIRNLFLFATLIPGIAIERIEVTAQCVPDGHFPTCPKPNPELREALTLGLELAEREKTDLLIATDPDSDRVGVAVRRRDGSYAVLTGNEVGLLLMQHVLRCRQANGTLPKRPVVVKTIVTSDLAFAIAADYGVEVRECLTGFKYIGEIIGRLEQAGEAERFVFGFEESCGYLAGAHVRDKDAVMACMLVAEMAQTAAAQGRTLGTSWMRSMRATAAWRTAC